MRTSESKVPPSLPAAAIARLVGHEGPIQVVRFTADGKYCLTGGHDRTVRLWNPLRLDPAHPPPPQSTRILPHALPIQVYSEALTHPVASLAVDEISSQIAMASNQAVIITDLITTQVKRRFQGHHVARVNAVAISRNAETYISASYDASVMIWDGRSQSRDPIQKLRQAKDSVTSISIDQRNDNDSLNQVAVLRTGSVDGCVRTYDLRMGVLKTDDCKSPITSLSMTRDGRSLAINCLDGIIRLMDLETGELINTFEGHHKAGQYALESCVTADDAYIITGSEDGSAIIYDLVRSQKVQSLDGHTRPTCSVAAHPKKEYTSVVITASYDGNATIWAHDRDYMRWQDT